MVDLHELIPASVVSNILTHASHPAAGLIKENLEEVESILGLFGEHADA